MENESFKLINTFRVDNRMFELYKNGAGQYKTIETVQGSYVPEEKYYENLEELADVFSDNLSVEELQSL
ncbi:hypothetical protein [Sunxiuqinia sp. sy24]|uniref:hypothetical protein n=1 Tax=Sunxiuqinia sp. sy24 TaxID=3461495 RepID=UPI004045A0BB